MVAELNTYSSRATLSKVQKIARLLKPILETSSSIDTCIDEIRNILDRELENDEYLTLVDQNSYGWVHTNRLREGMVFSDEVSITCAKTKVPISQLYPRNTGEVLIDSTCPVGKLKNGTTLNLRLGRMLHHPFLIPSIFGLGIIPSLLPIIFIPIFFEFSYSLLSFFIFSLILGTLGSFYLYTKINLKLNDWLKVMKRVTSGDLRTSTHDSEE